jgi:myosin heavy subunit
VWFREEKDGEWLRGCVADMQQLPAMKNEKASITSFKIELQNDEGDSVGEVAELTSRLVEGSFEEFEMVKLRNVADDDPDAARAVEDLITLNHLHEPAILTCLRGRFDSNLIYTNTGPILIAVVSWAICTLNVILL